MGRHERAEEDLWADQGLEIAPTRREESDAILEGDGASILGEGEG